MGSETAGKGPRLVGGRRVGKAKSSGVSAAVLKARKLDEKEQEKKRKKLATGPKASLGKHFQVLAAAVLGTVAVSVGAFYALRSVSVTPEEAATVMVQATQAYWMPVTVVVTVAAVAWFGTTWAVQRYRQSQEEAARAERSAHLAQLREEARELRSRQAQARRENRAKEAEEMSRLAKEYAERIMAAEAAVEADRRAVANVWSEEQVTALEHAKTVHVPSNFSSARYRWQAIAAEVPGKNVKECMEYDKLHAREERAAAKAADGGKGSSTSAAAAAAAAAAGTSFRSTKGLVRADEELFPSASLLDHTDLSAWGIGDDDDDGDEDEEQSDDNAGGEDEDEDEDGEDDEDMRDPSQYRQPDRARVELELDPMEQGTKLSLEKPLLWNIGTVIPDTFLLQLSCDRCGTKWDAPLSGLYQDENERRTRCTKCSTLLVASLRPCMAHAASNTLGFVDTSGCSVADVLPSSLLASCEDCGEEAVFEDLKRNVRAEHSCHGCHKKLALLTVTWNVEVVDDGSAAAGAGGKQAVRKKREGAERRSKGAGATQEGQMLPNLGACSHFRQSLRWFRFKCCGKAFPCPVCHQASGCASTAPATQMLCGKCSREQPFSNKSCVACGFKFGLRASRSHWQGGAGGRDTGALSSKDKRKHKGVSREGVQKTKSKKAQRVGLAAKKKREAAQ